MQRLAQFDVSRQFITPQGKLVAQVLFGSLCGAAMIGLRSLFDLWAPVSGPFALIYPTILLATLYGHWRAGLAAFAVTFFWAWFYVLPFHGSLAFSNDTDSARVVLNALCAAVVVIFAEAFRRAARRTVDQVREDADRRLIQLAEFEHRTKNNFAMVASLLEIQKRKVADPSLHGPLEDAAVRVRTFADVYSSLGSGQSAEGEVAMKPYLEGLLDRVERAAFPENVALVREIHALDLPREVAVALGLYVNEALANCVKYAFPEGRRGKIGVFFQPGPEGWRLTIEDDGVGLDAAPGQSSGLGTRLMHSFAAQARARHSSGPLLRGYRTELSSLPTKVA